MVLAFGVDLVLTRTLGLEQYGLFAVGISAVTLLLVVGNLGVNSALVKVIPAEGVHAAPGRVRGVISWGGRVMFIGGVVTGALLAAFALMLPRGSGLRPVLLVLALFLPVQALSVQRQSVLLAFKHPLLSLFPEQVVRGVVFLALLAAAILLVGEGDAVGAAWMYGGGILVGLFVADRWQRRRVPEDVRRSAPEFQSAVWWGLALPLCWHKAMRVLNARADPLLLGWLYDADGAALFAISDRLAAPLLFGMTAVAAVLAPHVSELVAARRPEKLQALLRRCAGGLVLYALPMALVLVLGGRWLLGLFGPGFEAGYPVLCLLVAGRTLTCLLGCVGILLTMSGHERQAAKIVTACAALKVALSLALIPVAGAVGAAVATLVTLVVMGAWMTVVVRRELGVDPSTLALLRPARPPEPPTLPEGRSAA